MLLFISLNRAMNRRRSLVYKIKQAKVSHTKRFKKMAETCWYLVRGSRYKCSFTMTHEALHMYKLEEVARAALTTHFAL